MAKSATKPTTETQAEEVAAKQVRPLGDRVVVLPDMPEAMTASGIVIPEFAREKPRSGTVISVGPGLPNLDNGARTAPAVEVGDTVLFSAFGGVDVELEKKLHLILREGDLLGVVEDA